MNSHSEFPVANQTWVLRLFVCGHPDNSAIVLRNLRSLCETHLSGKHVIEVVNIDTHPEEAARFRIFTGPTLLRIYPGPVKKITGDFSDHQMILLALGLSKEAETRSKVLPSWNHKVPADRGSSLGL